ncbi:hypothetical protein [Pontibacillus halophilus]|uniref:hypothetical protein n=1 Tax=Pontibacillus halophilus TaxID=516704 RepID=UPI00041FABFA|nr:hypothetical protein [Pontibacillus halophilus]
MLNDVLHLFHARQMYKQGYRSGLPGLIALLLVAGFIFFFEEVVSVLNFIQVIPLLEQIGLITNSPDQTFENILVTLIIGTIVMFALGLLAIILIPIIPFFGYLYLAVMTIILSPFILLHFVLSGIRGTKRWKKKTLCKKTAEVNKDVVVKEMNRMPTKENSPFYIGVTKDDRDFIIVPHLAEPGEEEFIKGQRVDVYRYRNDYKYRFAPFQMKEPLQLLDVNDFDYIIEPKFSHLIEYVTDYAKSNSLTEYRDPWNRKNPLLISFKEYVDQEWEKHTDEYNNKLEELLDKLHQANDPNRTDYPKQVEQIKLELKELQTKYQTI